MDRVPWSRAGRHKVRTRSHLTDFISAQIIGLSGAEAMNLVETLEVVIPVKGYYGAPDWVSALVQYDALD
jgi:hypothetical protein